jgi:hypothetical protein
MKRTLFLLVAIAVCTGCTSYRALTAPPPSRVASLNDSRDELRVSQGVALAFECVTAWGNPCSAGQASIDDEKVAKVLPAHLNRVDPYIEGSLQPTSYVVVGVSPGETTLHIAGEDPVRVVVVP